jgi:hypothetical protein
LYGIDGETIEPKAYQVSDQCVALERDNCFQRAKDPWMMAAREVKDGEISPSFVYKNKPILPGIVLQHLTLAIALIIQSLTMQ